MLHPEVSRKLLHFISCLLAGFSSLLIHNYWLLVSVSSIAVFFTLFALKFNLFPSIHSGSKKSWGIFYFPLAFLLTLILWGHSHKWVVFSSMMILAVSDSLAALSGTFLKSRVFYLTSDKKTIAGSVTFFFSCIVLTVFISSSVFNFLSEELFEIFKFDMYLLSAAIIIGAVLTAFEALSSKGFDNFTVPVFAAILVYIFFNNRDSELLYDFITGMILAGAVAMISYKVKFLTANGSVATFLLAGFIFGLGGWKWSVPILSFFILSSLLSKLRKKKNEGIEQFFEKTGVRDYLQVLANGGAGGVLVIVNVFYPNDLLYFIYMATLAAVCADTWATEIGTLKRTKTYNITNLKPIEQGMSGGISLIGSIGALLGAITISLSGIVWIPINANYYMIITALAGIMGSFFDSFLGATFQAQHKCNVCEKITERVSHCGEPTSSYKGLSWLNNDFVNLFAGLFGGFVILFFLGI